MSPRLSTCCVLAATVAVAAAPAMGQTERFAERERFLGVLSASLLGTQAGPLSLGKHGARGVVLAPPGTALGTMMTPFEAMSPDTTSSARLLEGTHTYDRPLAVHRGVASPGPVSLGEIWALVLQRSEPLAAPASDNIEADPATSLLFRQADQVDRSRGVTYQREPSDAVLRYREYELTLRSLAMEQIHQGGLWRLNPKLAKYPSIDDAKGALVEDWITYGYKREVDGARTALADKTNTKAWTHWSAANAAFSASRMSVTLESWVPRSIMFPPASEWLSMGSWIRVVSPTSKENVVVSFQVGRVRIIRPWLLLDDLVGGKLQLRKSFKGERNMVLSDGTAPTTLEYPAGLLAVVPEELVLVRNIRFMSKGSVQDQRLPPVDDHPLGLFAYPDDINLLGYVVRTLPRIVN